MINWDYLPFFYKGYDRGFNKDRNEIGQPIIEDYFVTKSEGVYSRQFWFTPDSLKAKKLHRSKFYNTQKGKIVYEEDFYVLETDSLEMVLERSYYYKKKNLHYCLVKEVNSKVINRDSLSLIQGDSILLKWKELLKQ